MPKAPFTQAVLDALAAEGWEEYPYPPDPEDGWVPPDPYYWIPAEHKGYWSDNKGNKSDNYRSLKEAIAWQLHTDTGRLTEELKVT